MARGLAWSPKADNDIDALAADSERTLIAAVINGSRLLQPFLPRIE